MTTEVVEQKTVTKKEVSAGALLILLLLAIFAFRKKEEPPAVGKGVPVITVKNLGFEGSPQTPRISKIQGSAFTALIGIENTGGEGDVPFELGIGEKTLFVRNDIGNSPWRVTRRCIRGTSTVRIAGRLSATFPARPASPYDAWVTVQGKTFDFPNCFTVTPLMAAINVLRLSWL